MVGKGGKGLVPWKKTTGSNKGKEKKKACYALVSRRFSAILVLALGAEPRLDIVPGTIEYTLPFSTFEDACRVNDKLKAAKRKNFDRGSPTLATISERLQGDGIVQAINAENTICPAAPPGNREAASKILEHQENQRLPSQQQIH